MKKTLVSAMAGLMVAGGVMFGGMGAANAADEPVATTTTATATTDAAATDDPATMDPDEYYDQAVKDWGWAINEYFPGGVIPPSYRH